MKVDKPANEDPDEPPPRQSSRPLGPPEVTTGPLGQLKLQLHRLYLDAGHPSYDRIVWLIDKDRSLPGLPTRDTVQKIMRTDGFAGKEGDVVSIATVLAREGHVRDVPDLVHGLWVKAHQFAPVGQLISELNDPFGFEVHRAIDASDVASPSLPILPAYVERVHDRLLGEAVPRVSAGASELVTLVGGSSTGKTRACWEALHQLPGGWRVWHPLRPDRPEAFLEELSGVGPATVVWLNEAQHYLLPTRDRIGEKVAAELRDLLRTSGRGPVLVLATLWPQYWDELTHRSDPPTEADEVHAQARDLLEHGTRIPVAATFDQQELTAVRNRSADDPRLVQALEHAEQGHITQYLAGGPALIERYEMASLAAKAMIEAAMDARRLGHSLGLPLAFLQAAAPAYLTDLQWDGLREDWLEQALAYVSEPCRGARGPLTRIRPRPGDPDPAQPHYRLADYLEQHGRIHRSTTRIPGGFWVAVENCATGDRTALGSSAEARGLLRLAFHLYTSTTHQKGNAEAYKHAARMLREAGRVDEAITWYQRAVGAGNASALQAAVRMLREAGRVDEALTWLQDRVDAGDLPALLETARILWEEHRIDEALIWYERASDAGDTSAAILREAGVRLWAVGRSCGGRTGTWSACAPGPCWLPMPKAVCRTEEAFSWLQRAGDAGDAGDPDAFRWVANILKESGRTDDALTWYLRAADTGDSVALESAAQILRESGCTEEVLLTWLQDRANAGDTAALWEAGELLRVSGRIEEALTWLQDRANAGDTAAFWQAARILQKSDRIDEALTWYQRASDAGDISALREAARTLWSEDHTKEALTWYQRAADAGDTAALVEAGGKLRSEGRAETSHAVRRTKEALTWYQRAADAGNADAFRNIADTLKVSGHTEDALTWYQRAADTGDSVALEQAAQILRKSGRTEEALTWLRGIANTSALREAARTLRVVDRTEESYELLRNGWEADGNIAPSWEAVSTSNGFEPEGDKGEGVSPGKV